MPFVEVDPSQIKFDAPSTSGFVEVDPSQIQFDAPKQKGFGARVSADYDKRKGQMEGIAEQAVAGDISRPEALGRMGLKYAQILPDVVGEGLISGFQALPNVVQEPIKQGASNVASYIADSAAGDVLRNAASAYKTFEQEHPVAAGRVGSVLDVGNLAAGFIPIKGKSAINAVAETAETTAKPVAKAVEKAAASVIPNIPEGMVDIAASAQKYKIPVSLDQVSGSRALKTLQKAGQDLPFSGQQAFREKQMLAFNRALFKTVGVEADMFNTKTMAKAFEKVGGEFDNLTKGKTFDIGGSFIDDLASTADEVASVYGDDAAKIYQREAAKVISDFSKGDNISGELIGFQRARVNKLARKAQDPNIKGALLDLENNIVDAITAKEPALQKALTDAKYKYKNLIVLEPIANKAKGGFISPSLLNSRVSQVYKRAHTIGKSGDIGELARIGNELLPELGGSDTAQKLFMMGAAVPTGVLAPTTTAATLGANRAFQSGINRNQALIQKAVQKSQPLKITVRPSDKLLP